MEESKVTWLMTGSDNVSHSSASISLSRKLWGLRLQIDSLDYSGISWSSSRAVSNWSSTVDINWARCAMDIPQTGLANFPNPNHMHSYYGPVPTWSPAFLPYPDGSQYPSNIQNVGYPFQYGFGPPTPHIATSSTTSARGCSENRPDCRETEVPCTNSMVDEESQEDRPESRETDGCTTGSPQLVQTDGDDIIEEPRSGMEFNSFEDLHIYYKDYAKKSGFGVMTQRSERGDDQSIRYVTLGCARGGKARVKSLNVAAPRPTGKTDCKARINALKVDGKMRLTTVHNTHNHGLSPKKARFFRCNREVSEIVKRVLDTNDLAGIRMNKSFGSLVVGAGGFENLPFLEKDCRNYIDKARHLRLGADPRSRAAYQYFGDVVTFDTTYLTNRYGMPFAPFVGVNHHGQSILLGAGLISSEDTETFTWLFQTWLQCMDGIPPKAIITDQDRAMKNAIAIVFPESRHRFCLWHILKKVPEKLGSYAAYKSGLKSHLMKSVYDTQTIEEFEKCWDGLLNTYDLHENVWLKSLYDERHHWVPVFLKEHFWAGMSTTQRSESMNAFFDDYVHARTNLKEFVDQFDSALRKKIENENNADFHTFSVTIPCISRSPIEKRFQELYTNSKFREVQQQVMGVLDMDPCLLSKDGVMKTYLVEDEVRVEEFTKLVSYTVNFNVEDCDGKCSCGLFEMRGILCRHILAIFKANGIKLLPDRYILDRWRKDIKRRYTLIHSSYDARDQRPDGNRYSSLLNICYQMITYAAGSSEQFEDAKKKLYSMIDLYRENQHPPSMTQTGSNAGFTTLDTNAGGSSKPVLSPNVVRGKGRPPSLRRASRMEKDMRKVKAKQKKAPVKGKRKQRDEGDTPLPDVCRNLFRPSDVDITSPRQMQPVRDSGTQLQETVIASQESIQFGLDGDQPVQHGFDGSQPEQLD
ncbi:protein FAR1-RELATED SEQUENCE 5-like [Juglans regia]|uniref:Protein FAR1-RELATED SEQUENCE n=1 Tax=Juglans regia TaxID=51240 RepID=A0A6P9F1V2_JUGRE|nr:protein FAR1-RELATED SEQUENCE 5-like [Juglans regia]